MRRAARWIVVAIGVVAATTALVVGAGVLLRPDTGAPPERATGLRAVVPSPPAPAAVAAAHPLAAAAGREILAAGGSAIDAAVAMQMVLNVVEPQSSGIGGGAFLLHWSAEQEALQTYDGRETAPGGATPQLFLHSDGSRYDFVEAVVGGRSVGTPGLLRMLELAHQRHGNLPWADLFGPAVRIAREGFEVTPRLHLLLGWDPLLPTQPEPRRLFYDDEGRAHAVATTLRNPELAGVLELVAKGGPDAFYKGPLARDITRAVARAKRPGLLSAGLNFVLTRALSFGASDRLASIPNPGLLTEADLASYRPRMREPVCLDVFEHRVCAMGPPSSGGIAVLQILGMLAHHPLGQHAPLSAEALHLIAEAERLAYADRDRYVADPDFVDVPVGPLLDPGYLRARAASIRPGHTGPGGAGNPPGARADRQEAARSLERPSTSHLTAVDAAGNVVAMTTSIENLFGSRVMVRGFLLNNQLTDFSFVSEVDGRPVANALEPGKRPRSSMVPLIAFDHAGAPVLSLGSPGGSRIIGYVAQAALGVLVWGLDPQTAIDQPHVVHLDGVTEVEDSGWEDAAARAAVVEQLTAWGHEVKLGEQTSGLHALWRTEEGWRGAADPRREGEALAVSTRAVFGGPPAEAPSTGADEQP